MKEAKDSAELLVLDFDQFGVEAIAVQLESSEVLWHQDVGRLLRSFQGQDVLESFTSGTTGRPKLIIHTKEQLTQSARRTLSFFKLQPGDVVLSPLSIDFIAGKMMVIRSVIGRLKLIITSPTGNPFDHFDATAQMKFSVLVPYQLSKIKAECPQRINELGTLLVGGGALSDELIAFLIEAKVRSFQSYGMTETMTHFALRQLTPHTEQSFQCLPEYHVSIKDEDLLVIHNDQLFDEPIYTSDRIKLLDHQRFIWLGRKDNVINSGGVKLSPELIERKIRKQYSNWPVFIISKMTHPSLGECPVFVHVHGDSFPEEVLSEIAMLLNKYEKPRAVKVVRQFQYTSSGKIRRNNLVFI